MKTNVVQHTTAEFEVNWECKSSISPTRLTIESIMKLSIVELTKRCFHIRIARVTTVFQHRNPSEGFWSLLLISYMEIGLNPIF